MFINNLRSGPPNHLPTPNLSFASAFPTLLGSGSITASTAKDSAATLTLAAWLSGHVFFSKLMLKNYDNEKMLKKMVFKIFIC